MIEEHSQKSLLVHCPRNLGTLTDWLKVADVLVCVSSVKHADMGRVRNDP